jgi:hypothetical protein
LRAAAVFFSGEARMFDAVAAEVEALSMSAAHAQMNDDNIAMLPSETVVTSNTIVSDVTMSTASVRGPCNSYEEDLIDYNINMSHIPDPSNEVAFAVVKTTANPLQYLVQIPHHHWDILLQSI